MLLSLDGYEFYFARGYRVRFAARRIEPTKGRPHGVKYSLTLHDPAGRRIYGIDNAHATRRQAVFDHRHGYSARRMVAYAYRGPVELVDDFYREVERICANEVCCEAEEATFQEFKAFTRAVVRGERAVDPNEPKIWIERVESGEAADTRVLFASLEAGAKLLSAKNRVLLRTIVENKPQSVSELAAMTGRAEQNVLRTLNKLAAAGIVRLDRGEGRARRPVLAARKVHFFEIDLIGV